MPAYSGANNPRSTEDPDAVLTVPGIDGRPFNARVIRRGDRYGLPDQCVHGGGELVEFCDGSQDPAKQGDLGQFTGGRYYASTLMESLDHGATALALDSDIPEWTLPASSMEQVMTWLREQGLTTTSSAPTA
jgi:hypothetical protein